MILTSYNLALQRSWAKEICKDFSLIHSDYVKKIPIKVKTSSGTKRVGAWIFSDERTGLTEEGNIIGLSEEEALNDRMWRHLKTVEDFTKVFAEPDAKLSIISANLQRLARI